MRMDLATCPFCGNLPQTTVKNQKFVIMCVATNCVVHVIVVADDFDEAECAWNGRDSGTLYPVPLKGLETK